MDDVKHRRRDRDAMSVLGKANLVTWSFIHTAHVSSLIRSIGFQHFVLYFCQHNLNRHTFNLASSTAYTGSDQTSHDMSPAKRNRDSDDSDVVGNGDAKVARKDNHSDEGMMIFVYEDDESNDDDDDDEGNNGDGGVKVNENDNGDNKESEVAKPVLVPYMKRQSRSI